MRHIFEFLLKHGLLGPRRVGNGGATRPPRAGDADLLAMGRAHRRGRVLVPLATLVVLTAALSADSIWYAIGRKKGNSVLKLLCRISLEPIRASARLGPGSRGWRMGAGGGEIRSRAEHGLDADGRAFAHAALEFLSADAQGRCYGRLHHGNRLRIPIGSSRMREMSRRGWARG